MPGIRTLCRGILALSIAASLPAAASEAAAPSIQALEWSDAVSTDATREAGTYDDVWTRVRSGFRIDDARAPNPLVATHESWFAARPQNVQRLVERARPYLYHIVEELEQRAMPMEIALLPMIESAFNPTAVSPAAASGIWQFIPSTGRLYGLKQDGWYDGRRDFAEATRAALDYLGKLYLDFGDWQLALAAYNCGEGCIARAIQKNVDQGLPTDYASLALPNETRHYVPKLLAMRNIVREPERFGVAIAPLANRAYFDQVTVRASLDVHSAARLAGVSSDEFLALNAAFPRKIIRSDTPVSLLVPVDKTETFQRNLEAGNWDTWKPYAATKGESIDAIAKRFGTSAARLDEHNQLHLKRGRFTQAQTILVPVRRGPSAPADDGVRAPAGEVATRHEVQRGETLFGVARRYGLTVAELSQNNPGLNGGLRAGQTLYLPAGTRMAAEAAAPQLQPASLKTATPKPIDYTVKRGDTLTAIAQRFDVSLAELKSWNASLRSAATLHPGQRLAIERR